MTDVFVLGTVDVFTLYIDFEDREVTWNITEMEVACRAGLFGVPRWVRTSGLPEFPDDHPNWENLDRKKVEFFKTRQDILDKPAIALGAPEDLMPNVLMYCIADGSHRMIARQRLGLLECPVYLIPWEAQGQFRMEG